MALLVRMALVGPRPGAEPTAGLGGRHFGEGPSSAWFAPARPWLKLYGTRLAGVDDDDPKGGSTTETAADDARAAPRRLSALERLPEECVLHIFLRLSAASGGRAAACCRKWRDVAGHPALWRVWCLRAWPTEPPAAMQRAVERRYQGSWRELFLRKPRLRLDGIYVSRNTYIKPGVTDWNNRNPVHLVCYFRYYRFLPTGDFLYKTTPAAPAVVAKTLSSVQKASKDPTCHRGTLVFEGKRVHTTFHYPGRDPSSVHMWLQLRSTCPGANNRMDVDGIFMVDAGREPPPPPPVGYAQGLIERAEYDPGAHVLMHRRGLTSYVFVPFEDVAKHELNKSVEELDYFIPG